MQSFLCRVLIFVFTLNCAFPAPGAWAQTAPAGKPQVSPKTLTKSQTQKAITDAIQPADRMQQAHMDVDAAMQTLEAAETTQDIAQAIVSAHQAAERRHRLQQQEKEKQEQEARIQNRMSSQYVAQAVSTYVAPRPALARVERAAQNEVLARVAKDDLFIPDMINYIDPFEPSKDNLKNTIYASEVLGNSIDAFLQQTNPETVAELNSILPKAQLRILYRLSKLKQRGYTENENVMAVGSLRITLWKIHNFYTTTKQQDPLLAKKSSQSQQARPPLLSLPAHRESTFIPAVKMPVAPTTPTFTLPENIYREFMQDFLKELRALKAKEPEQGDKEYAFLTLMADYAATYATLTQSQDFKSLVLMFDKGGKTNLRGQAMATDFEQPYTPVLNAIFISLFENTKYAPVNSGAWNYTIELLKLFSDAKQFGIPTRVFSLEAASLLFRPDNASTLKAPANNGLPQFLMVNSINPQEADRKFFANRVADIYCPMTYTHYLSMEDYGLDGQQMQMLADKLAYMYDGFYDISTHILTQAGAKDPHQQPGKCYISMKNQPNVLKQQQENEALFAVFVVNAAFWVYGGQIFSLIGTAYRTTKGAMVVLPKAIKMANAANKGRKMTTLGIEIQKGVRYANLTQNLAKNGAALTAVRVEKVKKAAYAKDAVATDALQLTGKVGKGGSNVIKTTDNVARQMATHKQLVNRKWLFGMRQRPEIVELGITQHTPGFNFTSAALPKTAMPRLKDGIKNWDDWKYFMRNAVDAQGNRFRLQKLSDYSVDYQWFNPLTWGNTGLAQITREKQILAATGQALGLNPVATGIEGGAFNFWKYNGPQNGWVRVDQKTFNTAGKGLTKEATELAELPDYYTLLGVSRNATNAQIKKAYREMSIKFHPDKNIGQEVFASQKMADINKARDILTNPKLRETYTAQLLKRPANATAAMPASEEGFSLAITRDLGPMPKTGWGKNFDPIKNQNWNGSSFSDAPGLGFNTQNWTGDVTTQLGVHLAKTHQLDVLGGLMLKNTRFWSGLNQNMKFFGAWAGLDMATYPFFTYWANIQAEEDYAKLIASHGDTFSPAKMAEDLAAKQEEQINAFKSNNILRPDWSMTAMDEVVAAKETETAGASVMFPIMGTRRGLSRIGIGKMPFISEQDGENLNTLSNRLNVIRAIRQGQQERVALYDKEMQNIKEETFKSWFAPFEKESVEYQEIVGLSFGETGRKDIEDMFNAFFGQLRAVLMPVPLDQWNSKDAELAKIIDTFYTTTLEEKMADYNKRYELMYEQQTKTVKQEVYDPMSGFNEETTVPKEQSVGPAY